MYALQSGRVREEKEFFTLLGKVISEIDEKLLICGDMNRHVRAEVDCFESIHGG